MLRNYTFFNEPPKRREDTGKIYTKISPRPRVLPSPCQFKVVPFYLMPAQTISGCPTCLYNKLSKITPLLLAVRALFGSPKDS